MARSTLLLKELTTGEPQDFSDSDYFPTDLIAMFVAGVITFFIYA